MFLKTRTAVGAVRGPKSPVARYGNSVARGVVCGRQADPLFIIKQNWRKCSICEYSQYHPVIPGAGIVERSQTFFLCELFILRMYPNDLLSDG